MNNFAHVSAATDISRFSALRTDARRDADAAFAKVAQEFEALFIQMMLKAARDATPEGGLFDSNELKLYQEMMDSQVALEMAERMTYTSKKVTERFFRLLQREFTDGELVELAAVIAHENFRSKFNTVFGVQPNDLCTLPEIRNKTASLQMKTSRR